MVRTVGLGLPQQHPLPSASATSSTSTEQHLLQRPEARERTPPSGTPLSALQQMLSEALEEFDYPDSSSASLPQHAIPPSSSSSASTPEPRFLLNDSEHIDPFVSDAIDRVISVVSPNDFSIDLSYETINFITQNRATSSSPPPSAASARTTSLRPSSSATTATTTPPPARAGRPSPSAATAPLDVQPGYVRDSQPPPQAPSISSAIGAQFASAEDAYRRPCASSAAVRLQRLLNCRPRASAAAVRLEQGQGGPYPFSHARSPQPHAPPASLITDVSPPSPELLPFQQLLALWDGRLELDRRPPAGPSSTAPTAPPSPFSPAATSFATAADVHAAGAAPPINPTATLTSPPAPATSSPPGTTPTPPPEPLTPVYASSPIDTDGSTTTAGSAIPAANRDSKPPHDPTTIAIRGVGYSTARRARLLGDARPSPARHISPRHLRRQLASSVPPVQHHITAARTSGAGRRVPAWGGRTRARQAADVARARRATAAVARTR